MPRYLEEIDPGLTAEENIRRMCFVPSGTLFKDFNEIFAQVFGADAMLKRAILAALSSGLQFENLIVNHAMELVPCLHLGGAIVQSAAPYRHARNSRGGGCQVDLLVQTSRTAYLVEIKRQNRIGVEVEKQVETKIRRLHARKGLSVRPVLVYLGDLDGEIAGDGFFDALIPAESLL